MLETFAVQNKDFRMSIADAGQLRQDTFRSMLVQRYVVFDKLPNSRGKTGFRLTDEGREALRRFESTDVLRKVASLTLTSYFHIPRITLVRKNAA